MFKMHFGSKLMALSEVELKFFKRRGPTLDKAVYLGFEVSPRNNPSDWSRVVFQ